MPPQPPEFFAEILATLPAAVYATDANGYLTYFNGAAERLVGRRPELGRDRYCVSLSARHADGSPMAIEDCPLAQCLRTGLPVRGVEVLIDAADGKPVPVLPSPTPLFRDGRLVGAVNVLTDLTELKAAQRREARRVEQQAALYRFTDRLYRADSLEEVYRAALDAITQALDCDRAAILLCDDGGPMRFVASVGLSETYRALVDGHSPWRAGDADPSPVIVPDVGAAEQPEAIRQAVTGEGIAALAFIPLVRGGGVVGKFMAYYDQPHPFTDEEIELAVTIARQLGFAIARERMEECRRATEAEMRRLAERLQLATRAGKVGIFDWDIVADQIEWTDSLYAMHGLERQAARSTFADWIARVHPADRERVEQSLRRALDGTAQYELEMRTLRPDGEVTSIFASAVVIRQDSTPVRLVGASVDISERRRMEEQRDLLLAELSHRVKNTLATVISIARQSFPRGGDLEAPRKSFEDRIRALAQTHTRLSESNWSGVSLETLARDELAPYLRGEEGNVRLEGPYVALSPKFALTLGMALHELATNAAKYGALSAAGLVRLCWRRDADRLTLEWREENGPPVTPPTRSGFGRLLLERALAADIGGKVALDFAAEGLICTIHLPSIGAADA